MTEFLYSAELAGLRLSVSNTTNGISLLINGYSDKQQKFLETILDKLFKFEVDEKRFEILYEQYLRGLKNFSAEQPYQMAIYYLAVILTEYAWTKKELIDAMSCKIFGIYFDLQIQFNIRFQWSLLIVSEYISTKLCLECTPNALFTAILTRRRRSKCRILLKISLRTQMLSFCLS